GRANTLGFFRAGALSAGRQARRLGWSVGLRRTMIGIVGIVRIVDACHRSNRFQARGRSLFGDPGEDSGETSRAPCIIVMRAVLGNHLSYRWYSCLRMSVSAQP